MYNSMNCLGVKKIRSNRTWETTPSSSATPHITCAPLSSQLHRPSPDSLQHLNVSLAVRGPKLTMDLRCDLINAEYRGVVTACSCWPGRLWYKAGCHCWLMLSLLVRAGGPLQYHCPQMENHCSHAHGHLIQETGQPEVHQ